jgi:AcrR family transcriptional regulator
LLVAGSIDRKARRDARQRELVDAAFEVFSMKGVAEASVDDIVRAAGVAKGTFYLYFATKSDAVSAVAARLVEGVAERIEAVAGDLTRSPVERLLAFGAEMRRVADESYERELIEVFHRPENRALHDRMGERALTRLGPAIATIIADGIAAGDFHGQDPRRAAAYVMACFGSLHEVLTDPAEVPDAIGELDTFVLRGLGFAGEIPA